MRAVHQAFQYLVWKNEVRPHFFEDGDTVPLDRGILSPGIQYVRQGHFADPFFVCLEGALLGLMWGRRGRFAGEKKVVKGPGVAVVAARISDRWRATRATCGIRWITQEVIGYYD